MDEVGRVEYPNQRMKTAVCEYGGSCLEKNIQLSEVCEGNVVIFRQVAWLPTEWTHSLRKSKVKRAVYNLYKCILFM
jgi:hypothetical protein